MKNPTPLIGVRNVRAGSPRRVGSQHLKMTLSQGSTRLEAIGFGMGDRLPEIGQSGGVDVAFRLEENHYNGRTSLQARLIDLRPAE
jgi:single-stranded-DNA-specific exonuclease